jgi:hypothetical protein
MHPHSGAYKYYMPAAEAAAHTTYVHPPAHKYGLSRTQSHSCIRPATGACGWVTSYLRVLCSVSWAYYVCLTYTLWRSTRLYKRTLTLCWNLSFPYWDPLYVMIQVMIHGVSAGATVPFSPLALVPPPSSRPDVGGTYAIIRVCYRPLLADRCETPPRAPIIY